MNALGSAASTHAVLTVQSGGGNQPVITTQPVSQNVTPGADVVFTVVATGTAPLSYQWSKNGTAIANATASSLHLNAVTADNAGTYTVAVVNAQGSATSANAVLTVQSGGGNQPVITTQPVSQNVTPGADVVFTVEATGTAPLSYQWSKNGAAIADATGTSLQLNGVSGNDAGDYSVMVNSPEGSTTSAIASLTVESGGVTPTFLSATYNGLFLVPDAVDHSSSGTVNIKTTTKGKFSGKLQSGSKRLSFSGQFDDTGAASVSTKGANPLAINLQLGPDDSDIITGTVSGGDVTANLIADRAVFDGRQQTAPQAGLYTLVIAGSADSSAAPGGDSVGTVRVDNKGNVRLAGTLADGTKFSQAAGLSKAGDWPLYVGLYSGQGSLVGWLAFGVSDTEDISGNVTWTKPGMAKSKFYPAGFVLNTAAAGFHYDRPTAGNNVLGLTDAGTDLERGRPGGRRFRPDHDRCKESRDRPGRPQIQPHVCASHGNLQRTSNERRHTQADLVQRRGGPGPERGDRLFPRERSQRESEPDGAVIT